MTLEDNVTILANVGPFFAKKLQKLDIFTIRDLVYHIPSRYLDYSKVTLIKNLRAGETVTIRAKIISLVNTRTKRGISMQIGSVEDTSGKIAVVWFNQQFLTRTLYPGRFLSISGKVGFFNRKLCLNSPDFEVIESDDSETIHTGHLVPLYPETAGFSSKWIRRLLKNVLSDLNIEDSLPVESDKLSKYSFLNLKDAIRAVHFPESVKDTQKGRERLAFDELLRLEASAILRKKLRFKNKIINKIEVNKLQVNKFIKSFPFELTNSQKTSVDEILADLGKKIPMNRLLEGDVGSGKTVIAAVGIFVSFLNGYQSVFMAPTQILAEQHYITLKNLFSKFNIRISLLTSNIKLNSLGSTDIYVGTHSLIHTKIDFKNVGLVVIDEQHRFGVKQRERLVKKSENPHILTMTATPIPRTVALTAYGDLDISRITELPKGRQKITTWVVPEKKRKGAYDWMKSQISSIGSQAFIVCPLIEASDAETLKDVKNVTAEFENLKSIFKDLKLGLLHGRMKAEEKNKILDDFKNKKLDILVSTPVIEVGIDIPNATIIVIEAAERFGLAQLHQLRGRVGRGMNKSYCLLFSNFHSGSAFSRLKAMEHTDSGFDLAELDLKLRGPGEIFGTLQSGFPELKAASWNNIELIKLAKNYAEMLVDNPHKYKSLLKSYVTETEIY